MTEEILRLMEKRRIFKWINNDQYKVNKWEINLKCRAAKQSFYAGKFKEI